MKRLPFTHRMLRQIIVGNKTQTRRLSFKSYQPGEWVLASCNFWQRRAFQQGTITNHETGRVVPCQTPMGRVPFSPADYPVLADVIRTAIAHSGGTGGMLFAQTERWICAPSIHMPAWLCPRALQIVDTRSQVLEAITEADANGRRIRWPRRVHGILRRSEQEQPNRPSSPSDRVHSSRYGSSARTGRPCTADISPSGPLARWLAGTIAQLVAAGRGSKEHTMIIAEPYGTTILYVVGAIVTLAILMGGHRPQNWTVNLVPENTVEAGDDILVPVGGAGDSRRMRVMVKLGDNQCLAIDIKDQQHHNGLAIGLAASWPVMLPILCIGVLLAALTSKQTAKTLNPKPRPRAEHSEVAECMRDAHTWRN